ncbi:MAG: 3-keto-5-aminohexanoate cleavage protein [Promethearchaeota archaeon]
MNDKILEKKVIITAALVGGRTTKEQNPSTPYTSEEYARETEKCFEKGASIVHVHARTDEGLPTQDPNRCKIITDAIKERVPEIILNVTTGPGRDWRERIAPLEIVKPEMCSLNVETMNFAFGNWKTGTLQGEFTYEHKFKVIQKIAKIIRKLKIKPEIELFSESGIFNVDFLQKKKILEEPIHVQYVFGVLGGVPFSLENLSHFRNITPSDATWTVGGVASINQIRCNMCAIALGGHVRVGLEDNIRNPDGSLSRGSFEQVEWAAKLIKLGGKEIATPEDARQILNLRSN